MIRIQFSLLWNEYNLAQAEAARLGIPVSEFVRCAVRQALPTNQTAPWMRFAGFVESGDPKSSQNIDETVYGRKDQLLR